MDSSFWLILIAVGVFMLGLPHLIVDNNHGE